MLLFLTNCSKQEKAEEVSPDNIKTEISERDDDNTDDDYTIKYYYDEVETTNSATVDAAQYSIVEFSSDASSTKEILNFKGFSTKQKYIDYGNNHNIPIAKEIYFSERMSFLADSAGLSEENPIPEWYTNYQNQLIESLLPPSNAPSSLVFGLTFYDSKNFDYPLVFNVGPAKTMPVMYYPLSFPYAWGNRVSRFKGLSFQQTSVTLHDKVFYGGDIITIVRSFPNSSQEVKLGSSWNNKASSFAYFLYQKS